MQFGDQKDGNSDSTLEDCNISKYNNLVVCYSIQFTDTQSCIVCVFFCFYSVQACPDVKYGKRIHILPIDDTVEGLTG